MPQTEVGDRAWSMRDHYPEKAPLLHSYSK